MDTNRDKFYLINFDDPSLVLLLWWKCTANPTISNVLYAELPLVASVILQQNCLSDIVVIFGQPYKGILFAFEALTKVNIFEQPWHFFLQYLCFQSEEPKSNSAVLYSCQHLESFFRTRAFPTLAAKINPFQNMHILSLRSRKMAWQQIMHNVYLKRYASYHLYQGFSSLSSFWFLN